MYQRQIQALQITPIKVHLSNVAYNAATQAFEARAVLRDQGIRHSYACMIEGPITMQFDDAAGRLSRQAFKMHRLAGRMRPRGRHPQVQRLLSSILEPLDQAA